MVGIWRIMRSFRNSSLLENVAFRHCRRVENCHVLTSRNTIGWQYSTPRMLLLFFSIADFGIMHVTADKCHCPKTYVAGLLVRLALCLFRLPKISVNGLLVSTSIFPRRFLHSVVFLICRQEYSSDDVASL